MLFPTKYKFHRHRAFLTPVIAVSLILVVAFVYWTLQTTCGNFGVTANSDSRNCGPNATFVQWNHIYNGIDIELKSSWNLIYVITPTYSRKTQMADLTKMAQTLMLVRSSIVWILLEDRATISNTISRLLKRTNIRHIHAAVPQPNRTFANVYEKGGLTQRNFGLFWLRKYFCSVVPSDARGWVYFADDDNIYDIRLFEKMKRIRRLGVWPVGFSGGVLVEGFNYTKSKGEVPHVSNWMVGWWPERSFAVDMGAFAISLREILSKSNVVMRPIELPEFTFLNDLQFNATDAEAVTYDTKDVLMWHTKQIDPPVHMEPAFKDAHGYNSDQKYNV